MSRTVPSFKSFRSGFFSFYRAKIHTRPPAYKHHDKIITVSALPHYVVGADFMYFSMYVIFCCLCGVINTIYTIKHYVWMTLLTVSLSHSTLNYYFVFCLVDISFSVLHFQYIVCIVHVLPFGVIKNNNNFVCVCVCLCT